MFNAFNKANPKMEFYKGVCLEDGRPVVVDFRRREDENRWARELRRKEEEVIKKQAGYSENEYKNRGDELYSWLSDLREILSEISETKKPEIIFCTYDEAKSYTSNPQTSLTRSEIDVMRKKYDGLINQKRSTAPHMGK